MLEVKLGSLPLGKPHRLEKDGTGIVVIRTEGGAVAYVDVCPHAGWRLSEGELLGNTLECPGHGWRFDLATGQCIDTPDRGLKPVRVRRRGDRLRFDWDDPARSNEAAAGVSRARRILDVLVSLLALAICAPLLLVVAILVKLSSPGPVLYVHKRVGRGGRPFSLRKFRTMRVDQADPSVTAAGDPRITPVGRFLRRWKLDELPQFWNVLRGEMTIIGPRPEVERIVGRVGAGQREILSRTPGLASMAQLVYPHEAEILRDHPDPETAYTEQLLPRKIAVDLEYERTRTFASDLMLVGELVLLVLGRRARMDRSFRLVQVSGSRPPGDPGGGKPPSSQFDPSPSTETTSPSS